MSDVQETIFKYKEILLSCKGDETLGQVSIHRRYSDVLIPLPKLNLLSEGNLVYMSQVAPSNFSHSVIL